VALLSGWVPRRRLAELKGGLAASCGERYSLRRLPAQGDETPVALENPGLIRPFQKILAVYGTPSYEEVEPTPLLAAGFVLLFGMMFGDLGQGLVLAAAGWGLRRFTRFRQEGLIVTEVGISAALFGLLFGSCFGFEGLIPPLWFSPMHEIQLLMGVALGLGVVLILTALALRIRNARRESSLPALLTDRYGVAGLVFYAGAVLTLLLVWQRLVPPPALAWLALPLAGVFLHPLVKGGGGEGVGMRLAEGGIEVLETVLGFLANTFSFLRVAAFGLAHVGLFMAVFALAAVVRELPWGGLWVILVHLVGNLIILALEGLVVSIQAVRLQFYEFFSKFFRGGGVAYQPLALAAASEKRGG
jgi:V/A-type H+-transporting ATPase subunit I